MRKRNVEHILAAVFRHMEQEFEEHNQLLGNYIRTKVINRYTEPSFSPSQMDAVVRACQETHRACDYMVRNYIRAAMKELVPVIKREIISDFSKVKKG